MEAQEIPHAAKTKAKKMSKVRFMKSIPEKSAEPVNWMNRH